MVSGRGIPIKGRATCRGVSTKDNNMASGPTGIQQEKFRTTLNLITMFELGNGRIFIKTERNSKREPLQMIFKMGRGERGTKMKHS